jgi:hypothetical protein
MNGMFLAVLITAGAIALLVAMGWLTDKLVRSQADRWAKTLLHKDDSERRR